MNEELYFKDAFTEVDGSINLEVNNLKANCITSNNNKFSLDSEGNLIVNSITTSTSNDSNIDFDMIYPVGSIYLSLANTNPSVLFGGVWESIAKGRTLVGVDESQSEFNIVKKEGGEKTHKLSIAEMPNHTHDIYQDNGSGRKDIPVYGQYSDLNNVGFMNFRYTCNYEYTQGGQGKFYNTDNGGNQSHNNLQPYLTCYIWTRIS